MRVSWESTCSLPDEAGSLLCGRCDIGNGPDFRDGLKMDSRGEDVTKGGMSSGRHFAACPVDSVGNDKNNSNILSFKVVRGRVGARRHKGVR